MTQHEYAGIYQVDTLVKLQHSFIHHVGNIITFMLSLVSKLGSSALL